MKPCGTSLPVRTAPWGLLALGEDSGPGCSPGCATLGRGGHVGAEGFSALGTSWFSRAWEPAGRPSLAVAMRFLVNIGVDGDWLVGSLTLFLGEVLGCNLV